MEYPLIIRGILYLIFFGLFSTASCFFETHSTGAGLKGTGSTLKSIMGVSNEIGIYEPWIIQREFFIFQK